LPPGGAAADAAAGRGELEPAARREVGSRHLAQHGGETPAAQRLLEHPQDLRPPAGTDDDETGVIEAEAGEAGCVKVDLRGAP
jgi:hypothetical protein